MKWYASGGTRTAAKELRVGDIVAFDFKAWRISDIQRDDDEIRVEATIANSIDTRPHRMTASTRYRWTVLGEHYDVCVKCGDVQPCREQVATETASREAQNAERFELEGVCPSCQEPVTARQKSLTFAENVETVLGPPVTFHLRRKCMSGAIRYDQAWAKHLKCAPKLEESLRCTGRLFKHRDGVTTCTDLDCPSLRAWHGSWSQCYIQSAGCPRFECEFGVIA